MQNHALKLARRHWLAAAAAPALMLTLGTAQAAPPVVEVIADSHPPVELNRPSSRCATGLRSKAANCACSKSTWTRRPAKRA
jgi:hypothetical protein